MITKLVETASRQTAWEVLEHLLKIVPCKIHTILTDNRLQFTEPPRNRGKTPSARCDSI